MSNNSEIIEDAGSDNPLLEALKETLEIAELFVPVPLSAPGFRRARAAIAKAEGK